MAKRVRKKLKVAQSKLDRPDHRWRLRGEVSVVSYDDAEQLTLRVVQPTADAAPTSDASAAVEVVADCAPTAPHRRARDVANPLAAPGLRVNEAPRLTEQPPTVRFADGSSMIWRDGELWYQATDASAPAKLCGPQGYRARLSPCHRFTLVTRSSRGIPYLDIYAFPTDQKLWSFWGERGDEVVFSSCARFVALGSRGYQEDAYEPEFGVPRPPPPRTPDTLSVWRLEAGEPNLVWHLDVDATYLIVFGSVLAVQWRYQARRARDIVLLDLETGAPLRRLPNARLVVSSSGQRAALVTVKSDRRGATVVAVRRLPRTELAGSDQPPSWAQPVLPSTRVERFLTKPATPRAVSIATIVASGFTWPPDLDPSVAHCLRYDDSGALLVDLSLDAAKNALASMERSSLTWSSFSAGHSWEAYFELEEAREDAARRRAQVQTLAATLKKIQAIP